MIPPNQETADATARSVPFRSAVDDQSKWRLIDRPDFARRALDFLSLNEKEAGFLFNRKNVYFPSLIFPPFSSFSTEIKKSGWGLELMRLYKCFWPRRPHLVWFSVQISKCVCPFFIFKHFPSDASPRINRWGKAK